MYSFTTCPFCRKAKDYLEGQSIPYESIELDLLPGNEGNEIRAELGRMTRRTSVPSIFIGGERFVRSWLSFFSAWLIRYEFFSPSCTLQGSTLADATMG